MLFFSKKSIMKDKNVISLLFISIIPGLLCILCIVIESIYPGQLYALEGIGIVIAYMLFVALPVAIKTTGNGNNVPHTRWPTLL